MKRYSVIPVVFACALGPAAGGAQNSPPSIQRGLHYTITMGGEPVGTSEVVVEPERDGRVKAQPGHPWPAPLASIPSAKAQPGHPWPAPLASIPSVTLRNRTRFAIKSLLFSYHYASSARETWSGDRLISAEADTVEDGVASHVVVRREADSVIVITDKGERRLTGSVATASFWNLPRLPDATSVFLDVETGADFKMQARFVKETEITLNGSAVPCRLWQLSGDAKTRLWFDRDDVLVRVEYEEQGQRFVHILNRPTTTLKEKQ